MPLVCRPEQPVLDFDPRLGQVLEYGEGLPDDHTRAWLFAARIAQANRAWSDAVSLWRSGLVELQLVADNGAHRREARTENTLPGISVNAVFMVNCGVSCYPGGFSREIMNGFSGLQGPYWIWAQILDGASGLEDPRTLAAQ